MKKHLFGISAAMAVAGLIALVSARRIEAQFSSPVKIVNTTSAPAIASIMDNLGRIPYQSVVRGTTSTCGGGTSCFATFPVVPAGHRLVVTQIAGAHFLATPITAPLTVSLGVAVNGPSGVVTQINWDLSSASYVLPVTLYVDPGNYVVFVANEVGSLGYDIGAQVDTLTGYLLDCTAAPCAAIAP
jgi:hypothetical protein